MNCPVCDAVLRTINKHNVEVEICPDCKGVWLDRGELEKIIEIASADAPARQAEEYREAREPYARREDQRGRYEDERREHDDRSYEGKEYDPRTGKRRKRSMLGEIFDMFGGDD